MFSYCFSAVKIVEKNEKDERPFVSFHNFQSTDSNSLKKSHIFKILSFTSQTMLKKHETLVLFSFERMFVKQIKRAMSLQN